MEQPEQPFINLNSNDNNNINFQGNIYAQENQNQGQNQPNKLYMYPPGMNPPQQGEECPEKPNFAPSSENINTPYEKPLNSKNNQPVPPPQQYYPPPPSGQIPPQNVSSQPYYSPNQIPSPAQPYYPPPATGAPQVYPPNYSSQPGAVIVQAQPVYKSEYQQYNNISQINHKGIYQIDENTFYISTGCCFTIFPFIFFFVGLFLMVLPIIQIGDGNYFISSIIGFIFFIIGLVMFFKMYNKILFFMGPNTLTVTKKAVCGKQTRIYNPGELQRVEFNYNYSYDHSGNRGGYLHNYNLIIVPTRGNVDNIFSIGSSLPTFTVEEIDYFLYYINTHILTKMRV